MDKIISEEIDPEVKEKSDKFLKKLEADMDYQADYSGDLMSFDWVDEIEKACPFVDIIVRKPKLILVQEEVVVKVEKSKRINVTSVKDLAKHTNYIDKVDKKTQDVKPKKILDIRNEETYNIYENRFLYTLISDLDRFLYNKEQQLNNFQITNNKKLEYAANTETDSEKINIEIRLTSESLPTGTQDEKLEKELEKIKFRIKRIREYLNSWQHSEMVKALDKAHISTIKPPVKPTNIILKNPNFQLAVKLWDYIRTYDFVNKDDESKENLQSDGSDTLKLFLNHSFLIDYYVLDSISKTKREQKEKISKYAVELLTEEINRTISLLLDNGIKITDEELLSLIAKDIKNQKSERLVGVDDVKKKFKNAMDEYLERTQDYL